MPPNATTEGSPVTAAIGIDDDAWRAAVDAPEALCERAAAAAVRAAPAEARVAGEVSILLADDAALRDLNGRYRGVDKPTNVLAFAALEGETPAVADGPVLLGDIAIARETVTREADAASKPVAEHLCHMVVHGMLHLLGYDHQTPAEADEMEAIEIRALASLGIANPYDEETRAAAPAEEGR